MRPAPLRPHCAPAATPAFPQKPAQSTQQVRFLSNDEAAEFLRLSPRTLEKQRVKGGGPRFRKFGKRVIYAIVDLEAWADARSFEGTFDAKYAAHRAGIVARGR